MRNLIILVLCCFIYGKNVGQASKDSIMQICTKEFANFLPKNYKVIDTARSDYDGDNLVDIVLILEKRLDIDSIDGLLPRAILILKKTNKGFTKSALGLKASMCNDCGGAFGSPYEGIEFAKNVLKVYHYGGRGQRWRYDYTFRYQQKEWQLIGLNSFSYNVVACEEDCDVSMCQLEKQEVNFSTKKMHIITSKERECKPYKDYWKKLIKLPKVTLNNFDVETDYFAQMR